MFDDSGEQTTVTRTVDGQTVRQTTIQKKNGETESVEDLINMDESKGKTRSIRKMLGLFATASLSLIHI